MVRLDFRQVEGLLYGLGSPPEANVARSRLGEPRQGRPGPSAPYRQVIGRIEVAAAASTLSEHDRLVLIEHYVLGRPQPGFMRRRAIRALRLVLDGS